MTGRYEKASGIRMESREMQEFGREVRMRAQAWRMANTALKQQGKRATKEQRAKLIDQIDKGLKLAK